MTASVSGNNLGNKGAAIGSGSEGSGTVTIYGGTVNASVSGSLGQGAAIGSGYYGSSKVTISGGTVTAAVLENTGGAAIGGSYDGSGEVVITGGTVTATTSGGGAAIGSGCGYNGSSKVTISGGKVTAIGNGYGAAIGNGIDGSGGSVTFGDGMRVLAGASESGAAAALKDDRETACRSNPWVRVEDCPHDMGVTLTGDGKYSCGPCGLLSSGSDTASCAVDIRSAEDWNQLRTSLESGLPTGGRRFRLLSDISVATMIGSKDKPFEGTFDGGGNTLTFNYESAPEDCAPFQYIRDAEFDGLHVTGTIMTGNRWAAGLAANALGTCKITNCRSSITIDASCIGDTTYAGFVSVMAKNSNADLTITGCVFDGRILSKSGENDAGFVGYARGSLTIKDSLFIPAKFEAVTGSENFARRENDSVSVSLDNCYYHDVTLGDNQGARAYAAAPDAGIGIEGNSGERYETSGIAVLENGMLFGGKYYGPEGAEAVLRLRSTVPEEQAVCYFAGGEPMTRIVGNDWKLTMPAADVTVRAELLPIGAYGAPDVRIPEGAKRIGAHAFSGIAAEVVYVPDECGTLEAHAFANCPNLRQIRLPKDCAIDPAAFFGCPNLTAIFAPEGGGTKEWAAKYGYGFQGE